MLLKKLLIVFGASVGILSITSATFYADDKVHEVNDLRMRTEVAESELRQVMGERDYAQEEASDWRREYERMEKEVRRVTEERDYWIRKHGYAEGQSRRVTEERVACEDRARERNELLEAGVLRRK